MRFRMTWILWGIAAWLLLAGGVWASIQLWRWIL